MLKKLVKYGNSNALILDRAILELLNISEGAVLKLQTDGKSLIITPHDSTQSMDVHRSGLEMMQHTVQATLKKSMESIEADAAKKHQADQWMPGTENGSKLQEAFSKIMKKYDSDIAMLASEAFLQEVDVLAEKYHGDKTSAEFLKEFLALRIQHAPNLVTMDKEMLEATKALGMPSFV